MRDTTSFYKQVGENIRKSRAKLDKSQDEVAMTVGLQRSSISNIEKGRQKLLLHTFIEIAGALQTEPSNLLAPRSEPPHGAIQWETQKKLSDPPEKASAFIEAAVGLQKRPKKKRGG